MGKLYRRNSRDEWEEISEAQQDQEADDYFYFLNCISISIVLAIPIELICDWGIVTPILSIFVTPMVLRAFLQIEIKYIFIASICCWLFILFDIFILDWYCLSTFIK